MELYCRWRVEAVIFIFVKPSIVFGEGGLWESSLRFHNSSVKLRVNTILYGMPSPSIGRAIHFLLLRNEGWSQAQLSCSHIQIWCSHLCCSHSCAHLLMMSRIGALVVFPLVGVYKQHRCTDALIHITNTHTTFFLFAMPPFFMNLCGTLTRGNVNGITRITQKPCRKLVCEMPIMLRPFIIAASSRIQTNFI